MSLSDKRESIDLIQEILNVEWVYLEEDVKEFIRKRLEKLNLLFINSKTINGELYIKYGDLKKFEDGFKKEAGKELCQQKENAK